MIELPHHPLGTLFPLMDGPEFEALAEDIRVNGLHEPIKLFDGQVLDGRNRLIACKLAEVEPRFEEFTGGDPLGYVVSLNLKRRHLDESQRAMVAARIATLSEGRPSNTASIEAVSQSAAADMLNVSRSGVQRAREVLDEGAPELIAAVDRGEVSVSAAAAVAHLPEPEQHEIVARGEKEIIAAARIINLRKFNEKQLNAIAKTHAVEFNAKTLGKFAVIYADPPWSYENPKISSPSHRIESHYPTMSLADICALPVAEIANENAILFLWVTAPKLAECMQVIDAWGFSYKTSMIWAKDKIGTGYYVRNQHEHLLICKRGDIPPPPESARCGSLIEAPRLEHSSKPHIFYDIIDAMYPGLRKIELFSRTPRDGWESWGNQVGGAK